MLTPLLESLVLGGKAVIKTHNHGVGGVGTIPVPGGKQIVIVQIIWHPFVDVNGGSDKPDLLLGASGSFLHTLKLRNKQSRYAYSFRDTMKAVSSEKSVASADGTIRIVPTINFMPERAQIINTFLPFTEGNVEIDIMKFNDFYNWIVYRDYLPGSTVEPPGGEGYGNVTMAANKYRAVMNTQFFGFTPPPFLPINYTPPTSFRGTVSGAGSTNEFEGQLPLTTPPNYAAFPVPEAHPKNEDVGMFPMVTFTYVEINGRYIPGEVPQSVNHAIKKF